MKPALLASIISTVQRNCDIADAKYGGEDTLCIYLLRMRDYYHWVSGLPMQTPVPREALGQWIANTESAWDELEEQEFDGVPLPGGQVDCFDSTAVNQVLNPLGYVYSAGRGHRGRPLFFLGALIRTETEGLGKVLISGQELARGLVAPPAMTLGDAIFIRRDALRRYLHGMVEEWSMNKGQQAMAQAISHYNFDSDPARALEAMVDHELENLILHELGEQVAGELIGDRWHAMLAAMDNPIDEYRARAVRDNLADCATSLPSFLALDDIASLDFYYANMSPLRREMFPSFCKAYRDSRSSGEFSKLAMVIRHARQHWLGVGRQLVTRVDRQPAHALHDFLAGSAY